MTRFIPAKFTALLLKLIISNAIAVVQLQSEFREFKRQLRKEWKKK